MLPLLLLLLLCYLPSLSKAQQCPAPFSVQAGRCLFVDTSQSSAWCSANRQCASIGGELVNSHDTIKLMEGRIPMADCSCNLWVGLSDMAEDRNTSTAGWQMINGNGIFPDDASLFATKEPSGSRDPSASCLRASSVRLLRDSKCDRLNGIACEFQSSARQQMVSGTWTMTAFKREYYNTDYCFNDVPNVSNSLQCIAAAQRSGNSRHALYNRQLKTCRLMLFTDSRVEQAIETSADWVKFIWSERRDS